MNTYVYMCVPHVAPHIPPSHGKLQHGVSLLSKNKKKVLADDADEADAARRHAWPGQHAQRRGPEVLVTGHTRP